MSNDTRNTSDASGAVAMPNPLGRRGLIRSIAHLDADVAAYCFTFG